MNISAAAWTVLARDGLSDLSVRKVAAEVGLPPSSLRYLFPTQASLREQVIDLVLDRVKDRTDAIAGPGGDAAWARTALLEVLPLDEIRITEMEVYLALGTAAMTDPALRDGHQRVHQAIRGVCARAARAVLGPEAAPVEVERLHALVDGLALHLVRDPSRADGQWAVEVLDAHLASLSGSAGSRRA